jgi:hypothetical protein
MKLVDLGTGGKTSANGDDEMLSLSAVKSSPLGRVAGADVTSDKDQNTNLKADALGSDLINTGSQSSPGSTRGTRTESKGGLGGLVGGTSAVKGVLGGVGGSKRTPIDDSATKSYSETDGSYSGIDKSAKGGSGVLGSSGLKIVDVDTNQKDQPLGVSVVESSPLKKLANVDVTGGDTTPMGARAGLLGGTLLDTNSRGAGKTRSITSKRSGGSGDASGESDDGEIKNKEFDVAEDESDLSPSDDKLLLLNDDEDFGRGFESDDSGFIGGIL